MKTKKHTFAHKRQKVVFRKICKTHLGEKGELSILVGLILILITTITCSVAFADKYNLDIDWVGPMIMSEVVTLLLLFYITRYGCIKLTGYFYKDYPLS